MAESAAGRSLVLTPNNELAAEITEDVKSKLKYPVFSAADLESSKASFTSANPAVAVVANRYDGIDFPDEDCRLLFVEGLPRATNLQERFLMNRMGANLLFNERVQTRVLHWTAEFSGVPAKELVAAIQLRFTSSSHYRFFPQDDSQIHPDFSVLWRD